MRYNNGVFRFGHAAQNLLLKPLRQRNGGLQRQLRPRRLRQRRRNFGNVAPRFGNFFGFVVIERLYRKRRLIIFFGRKRRKLLLIGKRLIFRRQLIVRQRQLVLRRRLIVIVVIFVRRKLIVVERRFIVRRL